MDRSIESVAESAYNAYGHSKGWKTHDGKDMPAEWSALNRDVQIAWQCAAAQVLEIAAGAAFGAGSEAKWAEAGNQWK